MIDIFIRRPATSELSHPRVVITPAPDADRAQVLVELLTAVGHVAGGRPSDARRGTVAELVTRRDAALDREIAFLERRTMLRWRKRA